MTVVDVKEGFEWPRGTYNSSKRLLSAILWSLHHEGPIHSHSGTATAELIRRLSRHGVTIKGPRLTSFFRQIEEGPDCVYGPFLRRESRGKRTFKLELIAGPDQIPFPPDPFGPPKTAPPETGEAATGETFNRMKAMGLEVPGPAPAAPEPIEAPVVMVEDPQLHFEPEPAPPPAPEPVPEPTPAPVAQAGPDSFGSWTDIVAPASNGRGPGVALEPVPEEEPTTLVDKLLVAISVLNEAVFDATVQPSRQLDATIGRYLQSVQRLEEEKAQITEQFNQLSRAYRELQRSNEVLHGELARLQAERSR